MDTPRTGVGCVSASLQHDEGTHHGHSVPATSLPARPAAEEAAGARHPPCHRHPRRLRAAFRRLRRPAGLRRQGGQQEPGGERGKTKNTESNDNTDSKAFPNNINPGNSVTASIAFDVPKGTRPTQVVPHDSAFSNGVRVTLR